MILNHTFLEGGAEHYDLLKANNVFNIEKLNDADNDYNKLKELYKNKKNLTNKKSYNNNMEIESNDEVDNTECKLKLNNKEKNTNNLLNPSSKNL